MDREEQRETPGGKRSDAIGDKLASGVTQESHGEDPAQGRERQENKGLGLAWEEGGMTGRVSVKELDPWLLDVWVPRILSPGWEALMARDDKFDSGM